MVVATMNGVKDYTTYRSGKDLVIGKLNDPSFYREILDLDHEPIRITHEGIDAGPLDNAMLRRIHLVDEDLEFLAKIYTQSQEKLYSSVSNRDLRTSIDYQIKHTKLWTDAGIFSPVLYGVIDDYLETHNVAALVFEYWQGHTYDVDVIAIIQALEDRKKAMGDKFVVNKDQIGQETASLEALLDSIFISTLEIIEGTHSLGTKQYRKDPISITERPTKEDYQNKFAAYLRYAMLWQGVNEGRYDISSAREKAQTYEGDEEINRFLQESRDKSEFIARRLAAKDRHVLAHGDLYLHHIIRKRLNGQTKRILLKLYLVLYLNALNMIKQ